MIEKLLLLKMSLPKTELLTNSNAINVFILYKKQNYYANLKHRLIVDIQEYWRTIKPTLFQDKKSNEKITLLENDVVTKTDTWKWRNLQFFFFFYF